MTSEMFTKVQGDAGGTRRGNAVRTLSVARLNLGSDRPEHSRGIWRTGGPSRRDASACNSFRRAGISCALQLSVARRSLQGTDTAMTDAAMGAPHEASGERP